MTISYQFIYLMDMEKSINVGGIMMRHSPNLICRCYMLLYTWTYHFRVFGTDGTPSRMETFSPGEIYQLSEPSGSTDRHGSRRINLGTNM